jgi:intracellular multiplication protein IcmV
LYMGIISGIKSMFNISTWIGTQQLKEQTKALSDVAQSLVTPATPKYNETFEEALIRLNLSEQDIINRTYEFKRLIILFSLITFFLLLYLIYLLLEHSWLGSVGCLGIMFVMIGQIFRYHFWLYQIQERKLGCTFREWLHSLGGKK